MLGLLNAARRTLLIRDVERNFAASKSAAAMASLVKLSSFGDPAVLYRLGDCHERGVGTLQNFAAAANWYEAAARLDFVDAMAKLGEFYLLGRAPQPTTSNQDKTQNRWLRSFSVAPDVAKATYWNKRAAKGGSARSQAMLGFQYASGAGVITDFAEARKWFSASALQGNVSAQVGLGSLLASVEFDAKGNAEAAMWFEKAAKQGDASAAWALSQILLRKFNNIVEYSSIMKLLDISANAGNVAAMFQIGEIHRLGIIVEQDISLAETWLGRASSRNYIPAFSALARLFVEQFSPPDHNRAAAILRLGAELDDPRCQIELGELLGNPGVGVFDVEEAGKWLRKAARHGYNSFHAYSRKLAYKFSVDNLGLNYLDIGCFEWITI